MCTLQFEMIVSIDYINCDPYIITMILNYQLSANDLIVAIFFNPKITVILCQTLKLSLHCWYSKYYVAAINLSCKVWSS